MIPRLRASAPTGPDRRWFHLLPRKLASFALLTLTALLALLPLWQLGVLAVDAGEEVSPLGTLRLPSSANLDNFYVLMTSTAFLRWLANSLLVSLAVAATGVVLSATAGYALSRFRFLGRHSLINSLVVTQIFPATMLLLPLYLLLIRLHLINTFLGLILVYLATVLPFCIWQMKSFYDTVPETLEEAASMDGCRPAEIFWRVILPVSAPGLAVTALFSFAAAWNEYVVAAILMQDAEMFTLPIGLRLLYADNPAGQSGLFAAGALLVALPMLALYYVLSRLFLLRTDAVRVRYS